MAHALRLIVVCSSCIAAVSAHVTPVEQVIDLLSTLKSKLTAEGEREATTYEEFACFCQNTTGQKSDSIVSGQDNIESLSATIQLETETKQKKMSELADRQAMQEELAANLTAENAAYAKEKAEYEATTAELNQAISGLNKAIAAMEKSKPTSFLAVKPSVEKTLEMAEVLGFIKPSRQSAVTAFLQGGAAVDPSDPVYKFHSDNIITVMKDVLADFTAKKAEVDEEFGRRTDLHNAMVESLTKHMASNKAAMDQLQEDIASLTSSIAQNRQDLVSSEAMLEDDQLYMKDLTERCETRAKEWDQRSQMRADELKALTAALAELTGDVKSMDEAANERAMLQKKASGRVSFLQGAMSTASVHPHEHSLLERSKTGMKTKEERATMALQLLAAQGKKLQSTVLISLVSRSTGDPFVKVKDLIQKLIERLLAESRDEATKKGFCDTELGKANLEVKYRQEEVRDLSTEIVGIKAKRDSLEEEIDALNSSVIALSANLVNATAIRADEKTENTITVAQAKEGLAAVSKAIIILRSFYKEAAKAVDFVQKASPVDEDTAGAGFQGAYGGDQHSASGIIGLLEVIKSDFARTIKNTIADEKKAASDFVLFDRSSKADVGGKSTKIDLNDADLGEVNMLYKRRISDLQDAQDLLDKSLQTIESLKPMCTDTTMAYDQRVALREAEIAALNRALCILDTDGVEAECSDNEVVP